MLYSSAERDIPLTLTRKLRWCKEKKRKKSTLTNNTQYQQTQSKLQRMGCFGAGQQRRKTISKQFEIYSETVTIIHPTNVQFGADLEL